MKIIILITLISLTLLGCNAETENSSSEYNNSAPSSAPSNESTYSSSEQEAYKLYEQARNLEGQKKYADALFIMRQATSLHPNRDFYFLYMSYLIRVANYENENSNYSYDEALQFAMRAIEINPNEGINYAEATLTAYFAQEFDLVKLYGEKAITFGSNLGNYYDSVILYLDKVKSYRYTITYDLDPNNPYINKKDGLIHMVIPTNNLPYQRDVKLQLKGATIIEQTLENGNELLYVKPTTSPFQAIFEVTKVPYSYKKQLLKYNKNAALPTDVSEYLKPTDVVDHNSSKIQTIAKLLKNNDDLQTVANILYWLKNNMTYAYEGQIQYKKVDELVDFGRAQCGGYSDLFAALARANNIPTRSVRGSTEAGDNSYFAPEGYLVVHSWNEFYLRNVGWIPVEPQRVDSIGVLDTKYIRLGHYSMSSSYDAPVWNIERLNITPSVCEATCTASVKQEISAPIAQLSVYPAEGQIPLLVNFDATHSFDKDGVVVGYQWTFSDGSTLTETNGLVDHIFKKIGKHTVVVTVIDEQGLTQEVEKIIEVKP